jgi:predicted enzyme related to lactoylglutathione lyase
MALTKMYFMLWVADMDRASTFYKQAFGLDEAYRSPDWTELRFGDATVALHAGESQLPHRHAGIGFEVDNLDAALAAVIAAGGEVAAGPSERPEEGIRLADCSDPEGNRFSLAQPLS